MKSTVMLFFLPHERLLLALICINLTKKDFSQFYSTVKRRFNTKIVSETTTIKINKKHTRHKYNFFRFVHWIFTSLLFSINNIILHILYFVISRLSEKSIELLFSSLQRSVTLLFVGVVFFFLFFAFSFFSAFHTSNHLKLHYADRWLLLFHIVFSVSFSFHVFYMNKFWNWKIFASFSLFLFFNLALFRMLSAIMHRIAVFHLFNCYFYRLNCHKWCALSRIIWYTVF